MDDGRRRKASEREQKSVGNLLGLESISRRAKVTVTLLPASVSMTTSSAVSESRVRTVRDGT